MKALDKKKLWKEIHREARRAHRAKLLSLRAALREARARRKAALLSAKSACRAQREATRDRLREERARLLAELRENAKAARAAVTRSCKAGAKEARGEDVEKTRAELREERQRAKEAAAILRIERANKRAELLEKKKKSEARSESDDEVRSNIAKDLVPLFERVRRSIKGSPRMSRTEAFLHYAEEHPGELLEAIEHASDRKVKDLEKELRQHEKSPPRRRFTPEELAETPF